MNRLVHTGWGSGDDRDRIYNGNNEGWSEELENLRGWLEEGKVKVSVSPLRLKTINCSE